MTRPSSSDPELLETLVALALQKREDGEEVDIGELCADCPELAADVTAALALVGFTADARSSATPRGSLSGQVFAGRYVLTDCVGAGAMGVVYKADDIELGRPVAVKVLRTELMVSDENERRFRREGEVLARLKHPAIATIHDRGHTADGQIYLVMEFLDGISMQRSLEALGDGDAPGRMPVREAAEQAVVLARALETAHAAGIIHRDIKPSNIMLCASGPVLIDFGIAAREDHGTLADGTRGVGTPAYMAPEQLRSDEPVGPRTDVYGLTATLYRMLTGSPPYSGIPSEVLAAIQNREPVAPALLRPDLPKDMLAILDTGLNRDPSHRYESMAELREDLEAFLAYAPVKARYPGPVARLFRRTRRSPTAKAALATVAAIGILAAGIWVYRDRVAAREATMRSELLDASSHIEPLLGLWNVADRRFPEGPGRDHVRALLDRAAANCLHPLPTLAIRAAFLWDHDERAAAAADIESIAQRTGSPVAAFLAEAYREQAGGDGPSVNLEGAPVAQSVDDLYLLAFHELRLGHYKEALPLLSDPRLDGFDPALELRLPLEVGQLPRELDARRAAGREIHEAVLRMEERYGRTTATTAHIRGAALLAQQRYAEAATAIRSGLELAPESGSLLDNLGSTERQLGELDDAAEHLKKAIALRPHAANAYVTLFWVELTRTWLGNEDALQSAGRTIEQAPLSDRYRDRLRAEIDLYKALESWRAVDLSGARDLAEAALAKWRQAGAENQFKPTVAACLAEGRHPFADAALLAAESPSEWWTMLITIGLMPQELDKQDTEAARALLVALLCHKAPEAHLAQWAASIVPSKR